MVFFAICSCSIANPMESFYSDVYSAKDLLNAIQEAQPGDTVYLHGTIKLTSSIEIECNGTEEKPIVFTSVEGESRPIIDGNFSAVRN